MTKKSDVTKKTEEAVSTVKHPIQPLMMVDTVLRFKKNAIVCKLLEFSQQHGYGLNEIACDSFSNEDREQLAQLIGYSHSGCGDLPYVSDVTYTTALNMYEQDESEDKAHIRALEEECEEMRGSIKRVREHLAVFCRDDDTY